MRISFAAIEGFKALGKLHMTPGRLEVLVGPNGSGKSSLFQFLRLLRHGVYQELPPEILPGAHSQSIFSTNSNSAVWHFLFKNKHDDVTTYSGLLSGPVGSPSVSNELLKHRSSDEKDVTLVTATSNTAEITIPGAWPGTERIAKKPNQLSLNTLTSDKYGKAFDLKNAISYWFFYDSYKFNDAAIRRPTLAQQNPYLFEDCSNLSSVLHFFMTEHPQVFKEIQFHLKFLVPGFSDLRVLVRGGPGEVMAFWREQGVEQDLSLADLSDGILRLLCWMALFLHPKPPTLICIDEPDLGVHPRTLPLLAGLIKKASYRTQIFVTTHNSYFLAQFDLGNITVFRKENGATKAHKPKDSETLCALLDEFGQADIANMHITEELELL